MTKQSIFKQILAISVISLLFTGCSTEIDNWNYPASTVSGRFLYKGQPLQLMSTASDANGSNMLQLHQTGQQWIQGFVKVFAKEDGTFTVNTFDGDYYINLTPGRGPWVPNTDTVQFSLKGDNPNIDFEVTPYFWISESKHTYADSVFTTTFNLQQVIPTASLERVTIYLGTTAIVDNLAKSFEKSFTMLTPGANTVTLDLKTLSAGDKANLKRTGQLYARVGVKTANVSDLIYVQTVKLH